MKITIKLFATLRKGRFDSRDSQLAEGATVRDALESVAIPVTEAAILFLNGKHASLDSPLAEGDSLAIFPPVGGG